ncbi:MAG TPA: hypothetical protein VN939_19120 [Chthoniobacterales bacterium]|nr:hypothetical protein [Chthoniobacterales bacterium]
MYVANEYDRTVSVIGRQYSFADQPLLSFVTLNVLERQIASSLGLHQSLGGFVPRATFLSPILPSGLSCSTFPTWLSPPPLQWDVPVSAFFPGEATLAAAMAASLPRPGSAPAAIASQIPPPGLWCWVVQKPGTSPGPLASFLQRQPMPVPWDSLDRAERGTGQPPVLLRDKTPDGPHQMGN